MLSSLDTARRRGGRVLAIMVAGLAPALVHAQTDYYNLDAGRPLRVEDALVVERHALEWQMAPIRLSGGRGLRSALSLEPEVAWGALPRMQVEVGLPMTLTRTPGSPRGISGLDVSVLYAINTESVSWPGLALSVGTLFPVGPLAADRAYTEIRGIATRTMTHGRLHLNAGVTPAARSAAAPEEFARWRVGLAADHAFVVHSALLGAEVNVEEPLAGRGVQWSTGAGMRYQVDPRSALDVGVGRRFGDTGEWYVTMGSALSFGLLHRFGGTR